MEEGNRMILEQAIKAYGGDMRRRMFSANAFERYDRELHRFAAHVGLHESIDNLDAAACRSFVDTFDHHEPSTVALECTILSSFFKFLVLDEVIDVNPMDKVRRPKVPALCDRKRTRISSAQCEAMLNEARTWPEIMCLNVLAYTGARRHAVSELRWEHVDGKTMTFKEKGNKVISKPIADALRKVMTRYWLEQGPFQAHDWVIPNRQPTGKRERSDRIVYNLVKAVAARLEIPCHVHAFRAAFAVRFLQTNPEQLEPLRQLLGHSSIGTTQGYLSEMKGQEAMKSVLGLSFETSESDLVRAA